MRWIIITGVIVLTLAACGQQERESFPVKSKQQNFVYDCVDTFKHGGDLTKANPVIKGTYRYGRIPDSEEYAYGTKMHKTSIKDSTLVLIHDTVILSRLQKILSDLLNAREDPSGGTYSVYLINKKEINILEFGGYIYVTKNLYDRYKDNTDVLYFFIAHEIGHLERGHGKLMMLESMMIESLKHSKGATHLPYVRLTSTSFNKKLELEADYYALNLLNRLKKDLCRVIDFWEKSAPMLSSHNIIDDMLGTHPNNILRAQCMQEHSQQNFGITCTTK